MRSLIDVYFPSGVIDDHIASRGSVPRCSPRRVSWTHRQPDPPAHVMKSSSAASSDLPAGLNTEPSTSSPWPSIRWPSHCAPPCGQPRTTILQAAMKNFTSSWRRPRPREIPPSQGPPWSFLWSAAIIHLPFFVIHRTTELQVWGHFPFESALYKRLYIAIIIEDIFERYIFA